MPDGAPSDQVKKGRKYDQVLLGARDVFLADGFEGASVDDIARAASVSKATLYSYFPDKRLLFMEVAKIECRRQADTTLENINMEAPLAEMLDYIAHHFVDFLTSDFGQRIFRICVAESDRFPTIGQEFYASGPMLVRTRLMEFFQTATDNGLLVIEDMKLAADQFAELCKADLFPRMMFNMAETFTEAEKSRVAKGAVEMFMARYGA